jgi:predicted O-methyltransferase YrrM
MSRSLFDNLNFCPQLQFYFRGGRAEGRSGRVFESLGSLSTINNLVVLRRLMFELKPDRTLEVGLCFGASALTMAATHRDLGAVPNRQHIAVDPFQQEVWDDAALVALEKAELDGFVELKQSYSGMVLPRLWEEKHEVQLAYIDGSHIFEDVFVDCYFTMRLLSEGGIMALDDSSDPHVQKVVRFMRANMASCFEEVDLNRYRDKPMNPWLYQIAKRLGRVQMTAFRRIGKSCRPWDASFGKF